MVDFSIDFSANLNFSGKLQSLVSVEFARLQGFLKDDYAVSVPEIYDLTMRVCLFGNRLTHENIEFFYSINTEFDHCPVNTAEDLERILEFDLDSVTTDAPDVIMLLLQVRGLRPLPVPSGTMHGVFTEAAWRISGTAAPR